MLFASCSMPSKALESDTPRPQGRDLPRDVVHLPAEARKGLRREVVHLLEANRPPAGVEDNGKFVLVFDG